MTTIDRSKSILLTFRAQQGDARVEIECEVPLEFIRDLNIRTPSEKAVEAFIVRTLESADRAMEVEKL